MARTTSSKRNPVNLIDRANTIRNLAGLESGQTAGVAAGVTTGTSGTLTQKNGFGVVAAESAFSGDGDLVSGDGTTEALAYLFENHHFDNTESAAICTNIQQATVNYYVKFKNCKFSGYTTGVFRFASTTMGGKFIFENCEFDCASGWALEHRSAAVTLVDKCLVPRCAGAVPFLQVAGWTGTMTITDTRCDDSSGAWGATSAAFGANLATTGTIDVDRCEVVCSTQSNIYAGIRMSHTAGSFTVDNVLVDNCDYGLFDLGSDNGAGGIITNCQFKNMANENVKARWVENLWLVNCDFQDTPADKRLVFFTSDYIAATSLTKYAINCHLIRCKGSKTTGTNIAGNEGFEFLDSWGCTMQGCWIDRSVEDALEFVRPQPGCKIIDCVVDNVSGDAAVDIFEAQAVGTAGYMYVSNIFGTNVEGWGCTVTGSVVAPTNVTLNNILIDNSAGSSPLVYTAGSAVNIEMTGYSTPVAQIGDGNPLTDDGSGTDVDDNSTAYTPITRTAV